MLNSLRARACDSCGASAPNGNFQDVTQQRGAGSLKIFAISRTLSSTQWHSRSGRATWHILDISYGFSSYYGVWVPFFLPPWFFILCLFVFLFFFKCLTKYPDTFRTGCGQREDSTSCDEVPNCDTSEAERYISHQWCCSNSGNALLICFCFFNAPSPFFKPS